MNLVLQAAVGVPGGFDFFNYIQGTWTVPGYPTYDNPFPYLQTVYLFNSLEAFNSSGIAIIQPVQQWGNSAAGMCPNTAGFCMASWWVSPGITSYTPLVGVNPGDQIEGSIYLYSFSPPTSATYQVVWDDVTQGLWWWVDFGFNPSTWTFNTAQPAVLEAYNLYNCQNLPTGDWTQFSNIEMFEPDTVWDTYLEVGTDPTTWTRDNPGSGTTPLCGYGVGDWDFGSPLNNTSTLYYVN